MAENIIFGIPVGLGFSVQGFSAGETAEIQIIETGVDGSKRVVDTIQTTLNTGTGGHSVNWSTKHATSDNASENAGPLKANEYTFQCSVSGISANEIPNPLCLTTNIKIPIKSQQGSATPGKVSVRAGDGLIYIGNIQGNEATIRNVPVGTTEDPKLASKQTGFLISVAPAPSGGQGIVPVANIPKEIHGGGWEPANQPNYNGSQQDKPSAVKKFWMVSRAASVILGVMVVDDTHEPVVRWEANGYQYKYDLPMGALFVYQGGKQVAEYRVHNSNFGALPESEKEQVVASIDEYGNVTPINNKLLSAEDQEELDYRTYIANGGDEPFSVWKGSGKPLEVESHKTVSKKTRLPRSNGRWDGEPGNSNWYSDLDEVNEVTGGEPVPFKNGRPIFSKWSKGEVNFDKGVLNGTDEDFSLVYDDIAKSKGLKNKTAAKKLLSEKGLTPHHLDDTTIQLIPTKLHSNIPHVGSASDLRGN